MRAADDIGIGVETHLLEAVELSVEQGALDLIVARLTNASISGCGSFDELVKSSTPAIAPKGSKIGAAEQPRML